MTRNNSRKVQSDESDEDEDVEVVSEKGIRRKRGDHVIGRMSRTERMKKRGDADSDATSGDSGSAQDEIGLAGGGGGTSQKTNQSNATKGTDTTGGAVLRKHGQGVTPGDTRVSKESDLKKSEVTMNATMSNENWIWTAEKQTRKRLYRFAKFWVKGSKLENKMKNLLCNLLKVERKNLTSTFGGWCRRE